jgi:hypothetical protein
VCITQDGKLIIKLIDFDASAKYKELCHLKFSSAYAPPQLAAALLEYEERTGCKPTDSSASPSWAEWVTSRGNLKATVAIDIWAFGILAFKLCAEDGASMFLSSEADNIVRRTDLAVLAYFWNSHSLEEVNRVVWDDAADMILKCLQAAEASRPQSFAELLEHPFFNETAEMRYFPEPVATRAQSFHAAIESGDAEAVTQQLRAGGIHVMLVDESRTPKVVRATPLMRAAFAGDTSVARIVLGEVEDSWPDEVRRDYLDRRTSLGFTAYMIACACGHEEIARQFEAKGCNTSVVNNFGKTGAALLQATRYNEHGGSTCESLESWLSSADHKAIVMSCPEMGTLKPDGSGPYDQKVMDKVSELSDRGFVKLGFDRAGTSTAVETKEEKKKWSKAFDGTLAVEKIGVAVRSMGLDPTEADLQDMINEADTDGLEVCSDGDGIIILAGTIDFLDFLAMARKMNSTTSEDHLKKRFSQFAQVTPADLKNQIFRTTDWWYGYQSSVKAIVKTESQGFDGKLSVTCIKGGSVTQLEASEMARIMGEATADCAKSGITVKYVIREVEYCEFLAEYEQDPHAQDARTSVAEVVPPNVARPASAESVTIEQRSETTQQNTAKLEEQGAGREWGLGSLDALEQALEAKDVELAAKDQDLKAKDLELAAKDKLLEQLRAQLEAHLWSV